MRDRQRQKLAEETETVRQSREREREREREKEREREMDTHAHTCRVSGEAIHRDIEGREYVQNLMWCVHVSHVCVFACYSL